MITPCHADIGVGAVLWGRQLDPLIASEEN
jgi:hypothetical protein